VLVVPSSSLHCCVFAERQSESDLWLMGQRKVHPLRHWLKQSIAIRCDSDDGLPLRPRES
jgi:hypothetical protein